jgi:cell division transport system permease protein
MFLSVVIMSLTLLVLAVFLLVTDNILTVLDKTRDELRIYVYLEDGLGTDRIELIHRQLLAADRVETVIFVSKAEAMTEFETELGEDQFILESLETNPLPASFRITLKENHRDRAEIQLFAEEAALIRGVEEVNYGKEFLERFSFIARVFLYVDVVLDIEHRPADDSRTPTDNRDTQTGRSNKPVYNNALYNRGRVSGRAGLAGLAGVA